MSSLVAGEEVVFPFLTRSGKCNQWFSMLQMHHEHTSERAEYAGSLA